MSESNEILEEAESTLTRIQDFDPKSLVRKEDLGKYAFLSAVAPAQKAIQLFKSLEPSQLSYFPEQQLNSVRDSTNAIFNIFEAIKKFEVETAQPNVTEAQRSLVANLEAQYQHAFTILSPLIAFASAKAHDHTALEREARASSQAIQDQANTVLKVLTEQKDTAERIIQEVRAAAAEQGVSKQAFHFKQEADQHATQAGVWLKRAVSTSLALGAFAVLSLFIHKIPFLDPSDAYEASQLAISKVLIFAVIGYMLLLSARNFLSHRHNEVVNRHRQNALATFTALVEAASDPANSDIVLAQAAACIFAPQETGYAKQDASRADTHPALQLLPRLQPTQSSIGGSVG